MATDLELGGQDAPAPAASGGGRVLRALVGAVRPVHALKNLLVLVPLALAIDTVGPWDVVRLASAVAVFSLLTAGTYIVNDILDLESDRRDPRKRGRPLARGDLPMRTAVVAASLLIGLSLAAGWLLEPAFAAVLAGYLALTVAYSAGLKRIPFLDVLVVGVLLALRIAAGAVLQRQSGLGALIGFGVLLFMGLALAKRVIEHDAVPGTRYATIDRRLMIVCGIAACMVSLLPFGLFIGGLAYPARPLLWLTPVVIAIWVAHLWRVAARGRIGGDPLTFALRDPASLGLGALVLGLVVASQLGRL